MGTSLAILNHSKLVSEQDLAHFITALELQFRRDYYPVWGRYAVPFAVRSVANLAPNTWVMHLWDTYQDAQDQGTLGHHETQGNAYVPVGHIFVKECLDNGEEWQSTGSHEGLEMLGDEWINLSVMRQIHGGAELWPREMCDAVQGLTYIVNGVKMSNFVYPEYFIEGSDGPFDHLRALKAPFTIDKTGYSSVLKLSGNTANWEDRYGESFAAWRKNPRPLARKTERWMKV